MSEMHEMRVPALRGTISGLHSSLSRLLVAAGSIGCLVACSGGFGDDASKGPDYSAQPFNTPTQQTAPVSPAPVAPPVVNSSPMTENTNMNVNASALDMPEAPRGLPEVPPLSAAEAAAVAALGGLQKAPDWKAPVSPIVSETL